MAGATISPFVPPLLCACRLGFDVQFSAFAENVATEQFSLDFVRRDSKVIDLVSIARRAVDASSQGLLSADNARSNRAHRPQFEDEDLSAERAISTHAPTFLAWGHDAHTFRSKDAVSMLEHAGVSLGDPDDRLIRQGHRRAAERLRPSHGGLRAGFTFEANSGSDSDVHVGGTVALLHRDPRWSPLRIDGAASDSSPSASPARSPLQAQRCVHANEIPARRRPEKSAVATGTVPETVDSRGSSSASRSPVRSSPSRTRSPKSPGARTATRATAPTRAPALVADRPRAAHVAERTAARRASVRARSAAAVSATTPAPAPAVTSGGTPLRLPVSPPTESPLAMSQRSGASGRVESGSDFKVAVPDSPPCIGKTCGPLHRRRPQWASRGAPISSGAAACPTAPSTCTRPSGARKSASAPRPYVRRTDPRGVDMKVKIRRGHSSASACTTRQPSGSGGTSSGGRRCPPTRDPKLRFPFGLDEATLALESLVEETHQTLIRDGYIEVDDACAVEPVCQQPLSDSAGVASLDAVDRALDELKRGLFEIDNALGMPGCR